MSTEFPLSELIGAINGKRVMRVREHAITSITLTKTSLTEDAPASTEFTFYMDEDVIPKYLWLTVGASSAGWGTLFQSLELWWYTGSFASRARKVFYHPDIADHPDNQLIKDFKDGDLEGNDRYAGWTTPKFPVKAPHDEVRVTVTSNATLSDHDVVLHVFAEGGRIYE